MSNQQQSMQTEREPDMETEIDCPRCYDIMTLSYDFDKFYYFCEECNLSLLIKYTMKNLDHNTLYRYYILLIVYSYILPRSILSSEEVGNG
jgi:hypothetical protein